MKGLVCEWDLYSLGKICSLQYKVNTAINLCAFIINGAANVDFLSTA